MNRFHDRLAYIIKHYPIIQAVYRVVVSSVLRFVGIFIRTDNKLILFSSYGGKQYGDSPKTLFEAMRQDPRFTDYHYVWAFEKPKDYDIEQAKKVKVDSFQYFITALKAKGWVTNVNIERGLHFKKKNTVYLNTWHGTGPKKGGNAVKGRKDYDFSTVDIFCCDGEYTKQVFTEFFHAKEENMISCGRPREDELFLLTESDKAEIKAVLGIPAEKNVCLYMPTWREYGNRELDWRLWEESLADTYVVLVRAHHFSNAEQLKIKGGSFWYDVSEYPSVNHLYAIADILISDYSSAFFDYGLLGKPMLCFAYDYNEFEQTTGLFMDLKKEFPFGIQTTDRQVIEHILHLNKEEAGRKVTEYCARYIHRPPNATAMCLQRFYEKLKE